MDSTGTMGFALIGFIVASLLLIWHLIRGKNKSHGLKQIPGPTGLPLIGNLHQMGKFPSKQFTKWSKQYGSIYQVKLANKRIIVISDPKLSKEIFSNENFAGKPHFEGFGMYLEDQNLGMFNSDGEAWEVHRRFLLRQLRDFGFGKSAMETLIMEELNEFIDLVKKDEGQPVSDLQKTFRLAVVNSLLSILTSHRFKHDDPKLLNLASNTSDSFNEVLEKGSLLIFMPWLRHIIPELCGYAAVRRVLEESKYVFEKFIREHKSSFQEENLRDYIDVYLAEVRKTTDPKSLFYGIIAERHLAVELFDLFFAGSDSSAATLNWTILLLCQHKNVQQKLQSEIAEITGNSRKVSVTDKPNMPYSQALIDEVLRYSSLVPDGVQHRAMADKEFHGYHIPKDTWIQPNLYFIHHNPKTWGDPENFRPERFLSKDEKKFLKSENIQAFQVGRRQCVGESLARDTIFLYTTNLFQQFSMEFYPKSFEPSSEVQPAFFRMPLPFSVVMKDRFAK